MLLRHRSRRSHVPASGEVLEARSREQGPALPADPPRTEEIIAVMRAAGESPYGLRIRGLVVVMWRAGLRIAEALALRESDLEPARGSLLVRSGKGGRRRVVGMDDWGWEQLRPWLEHRRGLPVGYLFCAINEPHSGGPWRSTAVRHRLRRLAEQAGRTAKRDPAAARARQPRCDLRLPTRHRHERDHRDGQGTARSGHSRRSDTSEIATLRPQRIWPRYLRPTAAS
jgi:site-specific recombinase XerC